LLSRSNAIVAISSDFVPVLEHLVRREVPIDVVENWAPLDEVPLLPRDNEWALQNLAPSRCRFIYSGTLGFKHNPALLLELAKAGLGDVIIFSEGPAAEWLKLSAAAEHIDNLAVRAWLPFESLPNALAAADILVTILEPDAAEFAVPSKVLTYMCAGRAQLGAIPAANLAAALIKRSGSGTIVAPTESARFVRAAAELAADDTKRKVMARAGRKYAEQAFDIENITNEFELIFERALQEKRS
jgi:glycosyltransferase involved in cell wall biosynthesis